MPSAWRTSHSNSKTTASIVPTLKLAACSARVHCVKLASKRFDECHDCLLFVVVALHCCHSRLNVLAHEQRAVLAHGLSEARRSIAFGCPSCAPSHCRDPCVARARGPKSASKDSYCHHASSNICSRNCMTRVCRSAACPAPCLGDSRTHGAARSLVCRPHKNLSLIHI